MRTAHATLTPFSSPHVTDLDNETLVAPALAGVDMNFLETTFQQGMLNKLDGVSLHPYRSTVPESVVDVSEDGLRTKRVTW